ncbi:uncharacterized protein K452DRAFT_294513 [Aplosporella prunicola CBS 121167]|uniref:Peptidase M43 pregnancy-associated plasma-A domain-containing protein n=1 Tax=Aplosporella prunicola CBS 121167 TaxID=1176127 RepID=A0A6A6BRN4_9PEZI|nr:uncharacterized protein K452DRAFT_294513 [Aplosporella prunicola CBS 121167]KAF2145874.1 hypothetical protein K452DRAFT_294513 [Aplosporella prunicola CBS 121167]
MHFASLFALLMGAASAVESFLLPEGPPPNVNRPICGSPDPSASTLNLTRYLAEQERQRRIAGHLVQRTPIIIDTWFHVVAGGRNKTQGFVSNQTVMNQLDRLNEDFAPHGISFKHSGTTHTVEPKWSVWKVDRETATMPKSFFNLQEMPMRRHLRKGTYTTLNVFILEDFEYKVEGLCYPPRDVVGVSGMSSIDVSMTTYEIFWMDGCLIDHRTLPGSGSRSSLFSQRTGATLSHEVGHWLGLFHPFQSGCDEPNDFIDDTAAQRWPFIDCDEEQSDSCPFQEGNDPVHNLMGYAPDEFTVGQQERMHNIWESLRQPLHGLDPSKMFEDDD